MQEGIKLNRKRGWTYCNKCGLGFNFSDMDLIMEHLKKGCEKDLSFFGLKKDDAFLNVWDICSNMCRKEERKNERSINTKRNRKVG